MYLEYFNTHPEVACCKWSPQVRLCVCVVSGLFYIWYKLWCHIYTLLLARPEKFPPPPLQVVSQDNKRFHSFYNPATVQNSSNRKHYYIYSRTWHIVKPTIQKYQYCHRGTLWGALTDFIPTYFTAANKFGVWSISLTQESIRYRGHDRWRHWSHPDGVMTSLLSPNHD